MNNGQSRSLYVLMSMSVSLNTEQSTPLANFAVATTRGWETRAGSSLSLLTHAIQWVRTENEVCVPLWTCLSSHWSPVLQRQCVPYAIAAKPFWLAPLGLAQLSGLILEGTSFSIKKQGTMVKRNEAYFMLLFFLTVGFLSLVLFGFPCDFFQLYWFSLFPCVFHTPSICMEHMGRHVLLCCFC